MTYYAFIYSRINIIKSCIYSGDRLSKTFRYSRLNLINDLLYHSAIPFNPSQTKIVLTSANFGLASFLSLIYLDRDDIGFIDRVGKVVGRVKFDSKVIIITQMR